MTMMTHVFKNQYTHLNEEPCQ